MDSVRWLQLDTMDMDRNVYGDEPAWRDNWDTIVARLSCRAHRLSDGLRAMLPLAIQIAWTNTKHAKEEKN